MQLADHVPERQATLRIETGGRLVEEQDIGDVHDRPGDHQALSHASRELGDVGPGTVGEPELLEELSRAFVGVPRVHPEVAAVEVQVLRDVERAVQGVGLRHDANHLLEGGGLHDRVDAADGGPPRRRDHPGRQHPDGGRLARAIRAEQAEDLAAADAQVQVVDRTKATAAPVEDLGQAFGDDDVVVDAGASLASQCVDCHHVPFRRGDPTTAEVGRRLRPTPCRSSHRVAAEPRAA